MKLLLDNFESVNFHDAKVVNVEERSEFIRIVVERALIHLPFDSKEQKLWWVYDCSLACFGVSKNKKEEWKDSRTPTSARSVTDLNHKIIEFSGIRAKEDFLELTGHTSERKWGLWKIAAEHFELDWKSQTEFQPT